MKAKYSHYIICNVKEVLMLILQALTALAWVFEN